METRVQMAGLVAQCKPPAVTRRDGIDRVRIEAAAAYLAEARRSFSRVERLPEACRPSSIGEAHAIQDAVTAALGETVGAYKATAPRPAASPAVEDNTTSAPWLVPEGVRAPIFQSTIYASPADVPSRQMPQCGVEGEVAFRFRHNLLPRSHPYSRDEIIASVDAHPAIEVVSSRFLHPDEASFLERLADCVSNGGFAYGPAAADWRDLDLAHLKVTLTVNGTNVVEQRGGHPTGDLLAIVAAVVEMMRESIGLKAGQFVTCGSFTGLRYLNPGDACRVEFEGLGAAELTFRTT
jgi:2-keto-4-pentenoate hydratase